VALSDREGRVLFHPERGKLRGLRKRI